MAENQHIFNSRIIELKNKIRAFSQLGTALPSHGVTQPAISQEHASLQPG